MSDCNHFNSKGQSVSYNEQEQVPGQMPSNVAFGHAVQLSSYLRQSFPNMNISVNLDRNIAQKVFDLESAARNMEGRMREVEYKMSHLLAPPQKKKKRRKVKSKRMARRTRTK